MQNGSVIRAERQRAPDVWEFRWREPAADGKRKHRRIVLGSVEQLSDEAAARQAISPERNSRIWLVLARLDSFSSILKGNGEDVKVVQELLRHSTSRRTLDTYTQALGPDQRAAQSKVV